MCRIADDMLLRPLCHAAQGDSAPETTFAGIQLRSVAWGAIDRHDGEAATQCGFHGVEQLTFCSTRPIFHEFLSSAGAGAAFFFFPLSLFLLLRSLFFKLCMPALQTSA